MNKIQKRASEATARILSGVQIDLADAISGSAMHCAAGLRAQGWQGGGDTYAIEAYPGDREDLEKILGRRTLPAEAIMLEACIRAELDASA